MVAPALAVLTARVSRRTIAEISMRFMVLSPCNEVFGSAVLDPGTAIFIIFVIFGASFEVFVCGGLFLHGRLREVVL